MKKIGLLVAVEIDAVLKSGVNLISQSNIGKFNVYHYEYSGNEIIVIHSGAGQTLAAAAAEILIDRYGCDIIINFGIVGSLREDICLGNTCIIDRVVDYTFDTSELDGCKVGFHQGYPSEFMQTNRELLQTALSIDPQLIKVTCASGNKFVSTAAEKRSIASQFCCDIVEMEAAAILLICDMHGVPALFIKGISDTVHGGAAEFEKMFDESSEACFEIVKGIIDRL